MDMADLPSPEDRARELVVARTKEPGGPWFVELRGPPPAPVFLGPYASPDNAKADAAKLREYLAAVLAGGRQVGGGG